MRVRRGVSEHLAQKARFAPAMTATARARLRIFMRESSLWGHSGNSTRETRMKVLLNPALRQTTSREVDAPVFLESAHFNKEIDRMDGTLLAHRCGTEKKISRSSLRSCRLRASGKSSSIFLWRAGCG
jgi:hypothetical protein